MWATYYSNQCTLYAKYAPLRIRPNGLVYNVLWNTLNQPK